MTIDHEKRKPVLLLVEDDSSEGIGDFETSGAEVRDLFADSDEDELSRDPVISEEEQP